MSCLSQDAVAKVCHVSAWMLSPECVMFQPGCCRQTVSCFSQDDVAECVLFQPGCCSWSVMFQSGLDAVAGVCHVSAWMVLLECVVFQPGLDAVAECVVSAWMLANVHVGRVQPQVEVEHLVDPQHDSSDCTPILTSQHPPPITLADELESAQQDAEEEIVTLDSAASAGKSSPLKSYGSTQ